jgi:hypothetical protein
MASLVEKIVSKATKAKATKRTTKGGNTPVTEPLLNDEGKVIGSSVYPTIEEYEKEEDRAEAKRNESERGVKEGAREAKALAKVTGEVSSDATFPPAPKAKAEPKAKATTPTVGRTVERSLLIVLRAVKDLGGKDVPRASIYEKIAADGIGEVVGGDRLYRARKAEKALLTRTTLEGRKFTYTLTAEGRARIEAERVAEEIAASAK